MTKKAAKTGSGPAACVAMEQTFPEGARLINDDLAGRILPFGMKVWLWLARASWVRDWMIRMSEKSAPGVWAIFPVRKRYIDDKVAEAVAEETSAVVNLGAGLDTLAFRVPALDTVQVWEVDQPENIEAKRSKLMKALGEIPTRLCLVSVDFDHQELGAVLASQGYAADKTAFFVLEAVTQYLTEAGIQTTFDFLAEAPAGSRLVFTYVRKDFIEGKALDGNERLYKKLVLKDKSWLFGLDPEDVADFLGGYGWQVLEHLGYDELAEVYVKPTGRDLESLALERVVYAEKL
jgi:methyltransferase (TIGR00027 family)